jgi:hypothetical protein
MKGSGMKTSKTKNALKWLAAIAGFGAVIWLASTISEALGAKQPYILTKGDAVIAAGFIGFVLYRLEFDKREMHDKLDQIIDHLEQQ